MEQPEQLLHLLVRGWVGREVGPEGLHVLVHQVDLVQLASQLNQVIVDVYPHGGVVVQ